MEQSEQQQNDNAAALVPFQTELEQRLTHVLHEFMLGGRYATLGTFLRQIQAIEGKIENSVVKTAIFDLREEYFKFRVQIVRNGPIIGKNARRYVLTVRDLILRPGERQQHLQRIREIGNVLGTDASQNMLQYLDGFQARMTASAAVLNRYMVNESVQLIKDEMDRLFRLYQEDEAARLQAMFRIFDARSRIASLEARVATTNVRIEDVAELGRRKDAELARLEATIRDAERQLLDHRNTKTVNTNSFWIFQWSTERVQDNGESMYREWVNNLKQERRDVESRSFENHADKRDELLGKIADQHAIIQREEVLEQEMIRKREEHQRLYAAKKLELEQKLADLDAQTVEELHAIKCIGELSDALRQAFTTSIDAVNGAIVNMEFEGDSLIMASIGDAVKLMFTVEFLRQTAGNSADIEAIGIICDREIRGRLPGTGCYAIAS